MILALIYWQISFEKYVPNHVISLMYNFYFIFRRRYLIIKKTDSENVPTQIHDFERRLCTQTQLSYIVEMSQMNHKEFVHNTAYSVLLPYIAGLSL